MPVILGVAIYVMSTVDTLPGIVFLIWSIAIGLIDNIFKPILLSRGVDVPMAVIFIGAVGGFLALEQRLFLDPSGHTTGFPWLGARNGS